MQLAIENRFIKWLYLASVLTHKAEEWITDKIDNQVTTNVEYIGWGTGSGTIEKDNTALFSESTEARAEASRVQIDENTIQWNATMTATAQRAITEAGVFNAETAGDIFVHGDFTAINLEVDDKIEFTITLNIQ